MNKNSLICILFLVSVLRLYASSDDLKKSTLVVSGTYCFVSLLDTFSHRKSMAAADSFLFLGLSATVATLLVNDDRFSTAVGAGLIATDLYQRYQYKRSH